MSEGQNIKVFVRCRPPKDNEQLANLDLEPDRQMVRISSQNKEYYFDNVFPAETPQEEVFNTVVMPLIPQVLQGYNCAVLAYGQTGTGKTYTMEGEQPGTNRIGIIPRAVTQIFESLRQKTQEFNITVSFLELYSEEAYDLLSSPEDTTKLRIFDDKNKLRSVKIEGLKEVAVNSESDIFELLALGSNKRQTAVTLLNACSSRSHSIFTITVNVKMDSAIRIGKLNLVDLAGSENIARSGAQNKNAREAGNINQSLLTLTRVITALVEKRPHVPYRESKLTRILQDSLGGATRTSMVATISASEQDLNNTMGTLDYASRARKILNRSEPNRQMIRKTSDLESYKLQLESDLENRIRTEVALEFREETEKIKEQYKKDLENSLAAYRKMLSEKDELIEQLRQDNEKQVEKLKDEFKSELETELQASEQSKKEIEKELKIMGYMLKDKEKLIEDLRRDFKKREQELMDQISEQQEARDEFERQELVEQRENNPKKSVAVEQDDYANLTFTGDDEIVQVSTKKTRKRINPEPKHLTLSGKKRKLKNYAADVEVSPISPPMRCTRSRNTRRKLAY